MSAPIVSRLNETLSGRYRIADEIGEGGMATVFLADDLRHNRRVAIKVLKPELAAVLGSDRFLNEIQTTAGLQHPHILPLFDSGEADGFLFFVMPYIEGETLRDRIDRERQLPVDEAVGIATAVANALSAAHERGIVHRDIKPGNILLSQGEPLVADFGIALAVGAAGGSRLTETGLSVGTPYYMSPEQATGDRAVGPASDIFGLACVLYEMLVGEPPFPGATAQAVLGRIIQGAPVSALAIRGTIPSNVDAAIRKALEKLPADRFTSARDFAVALADPGFRHGVDATVAAREFGGRWNRLTTSFAAMTGVALAAVAILATRSAPPAPVIRYTITFSEEQAPITTGQGPFGTSLALSSDGSRLVYVGSTSEGASQLWLKERDRLDARPLQGTEDSHQPVLSPPGTRVAYITAGQTREIRTASLDGEPPLTLVAGGVFRLGLAWGEDGYVYFSSQPDGALSRVPANGGDVEKLSTPDSAMGETRHAWPDVLPSGRGVLVTVQRGDNALSDEDDVGILDLETGEVHILFRGLLARYAVSGNVVFVTHEGDLRAAAFDQDRLEVVGPTVRLLSGMPVADRGPDVALSRSGRLVYAGGSMNPWEVVWVDRDGAVALVDPGWTLTAPTNGGPELSPDGRSIAIGLVAGNSEVWVKRIGGPFSRLAYETGSERPDWSPDGLSVMYTASDGADVNLVMRRADGSGAVRVVVDDPVLATWGGRWSDDGEWVVFRTPALPTRDIYAVRPTVDPVPVPLVTTEFEETSPMLSPDGRYLAYVSTASGAAEVYVRPFPNVEDARVQISSDQGREPRWAHNGRELFYNNGRNELVAVTFTTNGGFEVLERRPLFDLPVGVRGSTLRTEYDVTSDDARFLMLRQVGAQSVEQIGHFIVVENFLEELRAREER